MNLDNISSFSLKNLSKINILLGKNGCGKSSLLRQVEQGLFVSPDYGLTRYITPERGGVLVFEAGFEQNLADKNWLPNSRRNNQFIQFRQQSVAQYRKLQTLILMEIEKEKDKRKNLDYTFDIYIDKINFLLDNIYIKRGDIKAGETAFKIYDKDTDDEIYPQNISSGESELISLGIEILIFGKEVDENKDNILFLDEPDVHLHPDLQVKFMLFLKELVDNDNFRILIATHSTAILGALQDYDEVHIAFMKKGEKNIIFESALKIYKKILPIFGAHPLSNLFNERAALLVEGEDDERIWQQAVRTSEGKISVYPCPCGDKNKMNKFEVIIKRILLSVYDKPKGFSLRDRDDDKGTINDNMPIVRMKLDCRCAENLILANEVLKSLKTDWAKIKIKIEEWLNDNAKNKKFNFMSQFKKSGFDRKNFKKIKEIRNNLVEITGSNKAWEVIVGQVLGKLKWDDKTDFNEDGSIYNFLGEKVVKNLIPQQYAK